MIVKFVNGKHHPCSHHYIVEVFVTEESIKQR